METLVSVSSAREMMLSEITTVGVERILIEFAVDRVLASDFISYLKLPPFNNSSMDGFVVQCLDTKSASEDKPVTVEVIGDITAGNHPTLVIHSGQTARIFTGSAIPEGGDAVIPVEKTNHGFVNAGEPIPEKVTIFAPVAKGDYIRPAGQDVKIGDLLLKGNKRLRPQDVGILAMQGMPFVDVYRQPRIGLLSTGDELLKVGDHWQPGKIFESNSYTLRGQIQHNNCQPVYLGTCKDTAEDVRAALDKAVAAEVDLILSSAGVSVGAYDYIRWVIAKEGELKLWRVNIRPGKPIAYGSYKGVPFVGLPGNPVSAFVGFEVFVKPMLEKMGGLKHQPRVSHTVRLLEAIESDGRESYLRASVSQGDGEWIANITEHQGSGNLLSLVRANALVIIPAGVKSLPAGERVKAWILQ